MCEFCITDALCVCVCVCLCVRASSSNINSSGCCYDVSTMYTHNAHTNT